MCLNIFPIHATGPAKILSLEYDFTAIDYPWILWCSRTAWVRGSAPSREAQSSSAAFPLCKVVAGIFIFSNSINKLQLYDCKLIAFLCPLPPFMFGITGQPSSTEHLAFDAALRMELRTGHGSSSKRLQGAIVMSGSLSFVCANVFVSLKFPPLRF